MPRSRRHRDGTTSHEVIITSRWVRRGAGGTFLEHTILEELLPTLAGLHEALGIPLHLTVGGFVDITIAVLIAQPDEEVNVVPTICGAHCEGRVASVRGCLAHRDE